MTIQQLADKRKRFDDLQDIVANGSQEDHVILVATTKKLDILSEVLLGNGHPEDSLVMQVLALVGWQRLINRIIAVFVAAILIPLSLLFLTSVFGILWFLIIHKATLILP